MSPISNSFYYGPQSYIQPTDRFVNQTQNAANGQPLHGTEKAAGQNAGTHHAQELQPSQASLNNQSKLGLNQEESLLAQNKSVLGKPADGECKTCESRKYQDGSNDPGVSFKTATKLSPEEAASAVRSHENEHVVREQAKAEREGRKVVSQSVTLHTEICPECGDPYISGGTTRTVTKADNAPDLSEQFNAGMNPEEKGQYLDMTA